MTPILPKLMLKRAPKPEPVQFEPLTHEGPVEMLFTVIITAMVVLALIFGAPEPVDCGVDRDAPTLEKGCDP